VCITNACFGEHVNKGSRTVVCCKTPLSKESTPICVLNQGVNESERLNLRFGSSATFTLQGQQPSTVHLTGYVQPEEMNDLDFPEDYDMDEEISSKLKQRFGQEDENEEMFPPQPVTKKRKTEAPITQKAAQPKKQPPQKQPPQKKETPNPKTQQKTETPATTQSPQNTETQTKTQPISNQNNNDAKEDTQKTADKPLSKNQQKKLKKLQKKQQQEAKNDNKTNDKTEDTTKETTSTPKESEKANETIDDKQESKEQQHEAKDNKTKTKVLSDGIKLPNGIEYKDIKVGSGDEIQNGQTLSLFYVGQLEDKKVFDKVLSGDGFEYHVGSEEPVKGWQLGMKGMKIGGKRRIVVPSKFAFGAQGSAEKSVPANATVTYTIEIKK
jgi:FKBP-type peptidyl-prolyl cis-trans isomerase